MGIHIESASTRPGDDEFPAHVNPILWQQSLGLARQISARVFRDGGSPGDAVAVMGLGAPAGPITWDKAVALIASELSRGRAPDQRRAA
ncbi:MAG: hypothetical protein AB7L90_16140 [Hyphomicrobiaceae bacterium]